MIKKYASICSPLMWVFMFVYAFIASFMGWDIPDYIYQSVDEVYPSQPYEFYIAILGILIQTISCYMIYKNSKYSIKSIALTFLALFIPWLFIPGVDLLLNTESTLVSISYFTYGVAAGALLEEKGVFKVKALRKSRK